MCSSVPVEEQAEFKQLSDDIQELQQSLNQDFRQKTVSAVLTVKMKPSLNLISKNGFMWEEQRVATWYTSAEHEPRASPARRAMLLYGEGGGWEGRL